MMKTTLSLAGVVFALAAAAAAHDLMVSSLATVGAALVIVAICLPKRRNRTGKTTDDD
jgi:hypothetical protein